MISVLPGESRQFCLYDLIQPGSGPLAASVTVTMRLLDSADAEAVAAVTASLSGTSDWCATLTMPTTLGAYRLEVAVTPSGGATSYQHEVVKVGLRYDVAGWTLRDLRRRVGRTLGDLLTCRATAASATGDTFVDADHLLLPNNAYGGRRAYGALTAAANRGKERFVAASVQSTGTITLSPPFSSGFAIGDEVDLVNERGIGWRSDEYHGGINVAIRDAGDMGGVPFGATITAAFDADTGRLQVPSQFAYVSSVEYLPTDETVWLPVAAAETTRGDGWYMAGDGYLELGGRYRTAADGASVRLLGRGLPDELGDDDDRTLVNAEYVEAAAIKRLLLAGRRMDPERERLFNWASQEERRLKVQAVPLLEADSVEVRR